MKQFLRHIFLLLALFMATANAWAADCTIGETHSTVTAIADGWAFGYKPFGQINLCSTRSNLKILSISLSVKMDNDGTQGFEGILKTNNGETLGECEVGRNQTKEYTFQVNKSDISSFILDASDKTYSKKRTVQISNIKVVYECAPSFDEDIVNVTLDDTPVGQTSTKTVLIGYQSTATIVTLLSSEVSDDKDFFSISPSTESVKTGSGTVEYTISFAPTSSVQGATAQYIIKGEGETKVTINVTGTSFDVVAPIHTWNAPTTYKVGDPNLDLANIWTSNSSGSIAYRIKENSFKPSGTNNEGATPLSINGNVLTLGQAGTLVIEMVQEATTGFYAKTSEQTITINKYNVEASISQSTAVWNEIIDNPFSLSYGLIDFDVESKNTNIAEYHKDTKKIQTYFTNGTASFQITRPEDYKYNALSKTLTLDVNQSTVNCPVLEDSDPRNWETINNSGTYTIPSGTPDSLFFQARRTDILGFTNTTEFYAEYSSDHNTWTKAMKIDLPEQGTWYDLKCDIPETAKYVRFITYTGATGNKHIRNVQVTRKTYLRPSTTELTLPQTTIGKSSENTFNLSWSTCSDDIKLVSNNDLFEVGTTQINTTAHTGTTNNILVRFKGANEPGTYSAVITIYDQSQSKEVKVSCVVKDRLATTIVYTGETQYSEAQDCIEGKFSVEDENGNTVTGANIVLTSSNEGILSICDNAGFMPHCGGSVTLTATYAGDDTHESCSLSVALTVPYCQREIIWETSYLNFATDKNGYIDDKRVLDATINPESEITYQLHTVTPTPFAEIIEEGGKYFVRVFGEGHGYLVAIANECSYDGRMYETTYKIKELRVSGSGVCDPNSLLIWGDGRDEPFVYLFSTNSSERTRIYDLKGLPAETMTFGAHAATASVNNVLVISFSTESEGNNWIGEHKQTVVSGSSYNWNYSCPVPAGAKRVRFQSEASLTIYFNGVTIPQQTYIRPSVESIEISDAIVNVPFERTFSVDYSNVRLLQWEVSNNNDLGLKVVANQEVNNDCDLYGTYTFTLTGESPYPQDVTETITFFTSAGDEVKIPVTITATLSEPFYFNVQDGDMAVSSNWTYNGSNTHGLLPDKRFPIVISKAMTINEGELVAYGVTIENGGSVNIQPKGGLTLHAGGFTNVTENNFEVHNNVEGAGFVRVSKYFKKLGGTMPKMKVHFTTKANMNNGGNKDAAWQYIGAPGAETQMQVVNTSTLYLRSEEKGWVRQWDSNASLTPFAGYAFTQKDQPSIDFTPRLVTDNQIITLTYTTDGGMTGDNLWANSYMAPIDIKKLGKEDFSGNVDQIVYLYNCGSWNEWNKDQNAIQTAEEQPGRYYAIPVGSARALDATYDQTVIPPMQGVYMVAKPGGGSLTLNYEKHVWNCTSDKMNQALRIAGKRTAEEDYLSSILRIRLQINSQNSGADRMYLIQDSTCTANYDNGFDAPKQMTDGLLNLYTNEACGKMEISATDNIDGIYLGFAAGEDEVYTMTFTSLIGEDLYLYDLEQDTLVGMANGETYEFAAAAKSTNDMRFQILVNPDLSDYQPNTGNGDVTTNLNDVPMQQLWVHDEKVYISHASANSILEVYTVSGMPVARYAIGYAPCTLNLSDLPTGVYMLRLNDTIYKFVCN